MSAPAICVLKTDGINCDGEMDFAFENAQAQPDVVHVNQLRSGERRFADYGALVIPGGFSYGDDIASGKVLANELTSYLSDQLLEFVHQDKPILGVCNGFQVLARTGLLPSRTLGEQQVSLAQNSNGRFDRRWIELSVSDSICEFVSAKDFDEATIPMEIAHGEGRFVASDNTLQSLEDNGQLVFRYAPSELVADPYNPNGSMHDIAGICDESGLILGMMPHPERSIAAMHPYRARTEAAYQAATVIFRNIVDFARSA